MLHCALSSSLISLSQLQPPKDSNTTSTCCSLFGSTSATLIPWKSWCTYPRLHPTDAAISPAPLYFDQASMQWLGMHGPIKVKVENEVLLLLYQSSNQASWWLKSSQPLKKMWCWSICKYIHGSEHTQDILKHHFHLNGRSPQRHFFRWWGEARSLNQWASKAN